MAERMFGNKVIPWIAASKSSDQKLSNSIEINEKSRENASAEE